jgi:hypothetical protein
VRVGGARPPPLFTFTITSKVAVYAPAEWADTLTLFHLYENMYSVVDSISRVDASATRATRVARVARVRSAREERRFSCE